MQSSRLLIGVAMAAAFVLCGGVSSAASFSFTGSFATDDQLQQFLFTLSNPATVTTVTWSYAGGTNQAGAVIAAGGFDPWLAIFDSTGNLVASVDNGSCGQVAMDPSTGACFDSFISQSLAPDIYTLVLSESDNQPVDTTLADGYTRTGQGNFTGGAFGCSNGVFCDATGANRTGNWAVDIDNVSSASLAGGGSVPEPGTLLLGAAGLAGIMGLRGGLRRRRLGALKHYLHSGSSPETSR
jgi:PEP-CTERM motif